MIRRREREKVRGLKGKLVGNESRINKCKSRLTQVAVVLFVSSHLVLVRFTFESLWHETSLPLFVTVYDFNSIRGAELNQEPLTTAIEERYVHLTVSRLRSLLSSSSVSKSKIATSIGVSRASTRTRSLRLIRVCP